MPTAPAVLLAHVASPTNVAATVRPVRNAEVGRSVDQASRRYLASSMSSSNRWLSTETEAPSAV